LYTPDSEAGTIIKQFDAAALDILLLYCRPVLTA